MKAIADHASLSSPHGAYEAWLYEERRKPLSALMEELDQLSPGQFCIPYRGYIINLSEVSTITPSHIMMRDGARILIKRGDYRRIRDIYFSWIFSLSAG